MVVLGLVLTLAATTVANAQQGRVVPGPDGPVLIETFQRPSVPIIVTSPVVVGTNARTGGVNTQNTQINSSVYDYGRTESINNGSLRHFHREVYAQDGRTVVGYEQGHEWYNSYTNRWHKQSSVYVPNNQGGVNRTETKTRMVPTTGGARPATRT